jgi:transcriptional regulator with XRE-family HTH domain
MDASTSAGKLIVALRQQFKVKGVHYREVAARLKVSEGTVKRYFTGRGVSINVLDKLAEIVDLDLVSLAALAQHQHTNGPGLTKAQKASLKKNKMAAVVLWYLSIGFTPAQLIQEFEIAAQMETILVQLQTLGLIRRLPTNKVKVLVAPKADGPMDDEVREGRIKMAQRFLSAINLRDERCPWTCFYARLPEASAARLKEIVKRFSSDVQAVAKGAIDLPTDETQWYKLFVGAEPTSRKNIFR